MSDVIPLHVTRWKCPHCNKSWSSKWRATRHVAMCWLNPANRSCKTCKNRIEPDGDEYGYVVDEGCDVGVEFEPHEFREGVIALPLHCPKWEAK